MAEQLFLRLERSAGEAEAVIVSQDGRMLRGTSRLPLAAAAALAEGRRVNVLVPASDTVVLSADIPKASAARTRSLLPFSLEDHFATDVEDLHFAAGRTQINGKTATTVIARSALESILAELDDAGIKPHAMYATCDGVPDTPSTTTIVLERDAIMGRLPGQIGFRLEGLTLDAVWNLLSEDDPEDTALRHIMIYGSAQELAANAGEIEQLRAAVADVDVRELPDGNLGLFAATLTGGAGTNLLQGPYAPRSSIRAIVRPWYASAGLAAGLILIILVSTGAELVRLRQADSALLGQVRTLCAESFRTEQLSACQAEARRRLASAGQAPVTAAGSFLGALEAIADAADAGSFETVSYRNDILNLDIRMPDVAALDAFTQRVAAGSPYEVRTLSNTQQDDGLRSRVQVLVSE